MTLHTAIYISTLFALAIGIVAIIHYIREHELLMTLVYSFLVLVVAIRLMLLWQG